jgi:hypothetical protein
MIGHTFSRPKAEINISAVPRTIRMRREEQLVKPGAGIVFENIQDDNLQFVWA